MEILSGEHLKPVNMCLLCFRDRTLTFLFLGMGMKKFQHGNYQAVHVYGKVSILEKDELIEELTIMLEKYEENRENPVLWDKLSPHLLESELKGIV
ncbi:hypothetical protein QFZ72_002820 [Bacillus sp. V2I10]|nr:hypothetical protein [Bacillus sp. V2I10]